MRMQRISRAPELSATLSLDSCWITVTLLVPACPRWRENRAGRGRRAKCLLVASASPRTKVQRRFAASHAGVRGRGGSLCLLQDLDQAPALGAGERPGLDDPDQVALARLVARVVGIEGARPADDLLVLRMPPCDLDLHCDRL